MRLYVGNLPFQTTEAEVRNFFEREGFALDNFTLTRDRISGESRGFGFAEIADSDSANRAIQTCNGKDFMGRAMVVNEAKPLASGGGRGR